MKVAEKDDSSESKRTASQNQGKKVTNSDLPEDIPPSVKNFINWIKNSYEKL
ncbi:MAG: hypothetical protein GF364_20475 [Candidatus Lokiarchaeota archaeon]|nr:hypothetical protein [Candidatus Lokiarchaeota archaeon]